MRKIVRILLPILFSLLLAMPAGAVPVAENQEIQTYRGVSVGGQLCAATPDGGGVSYTLTTYPCKGSVELQEDGSFVYTPQENRRGRDYFGYRAVDAEGNVSQEAVVIIRLLRRRQSERYEDTAGLRCDYAAHALAERGLMQGQTLAGHALFEPERNMSRGEFLVLAMESAHRSPLSAVLRSGYEDDGEMAAWLKPYATAARFDGYVTEGSCRANEPITVREAAELVNAVFALTDAPAREGEEQSAANLRQCGVWDSPVEDVPLTRGEAAMLLIRTVEMLER